MTTHPYHHRRGARSSASAKQAAAFRSLLLAAALGLSVTSASAQSNASGAITGSIPAGTRTEISSINTETGGTRTVQSETDGSFSIRALPPGHYRVQYKDSAGAVHEAQTDVILGSSASVNLAGEQTLQLERFVVSGYSVNPVDFQKTESTTVFTEKSLAVLPVAQNINAIALLAPGTTQGSSSFGSLVSFGGASVAENTYYLNGFNISNFRNGLDPSTVPYEFYDQFELKTGAYSAEFGRSTGGVVNTTSKYGKNEVHAGFSAYYTPNDLRSQRASNYTADGKPYSYNAKDTKDGLTTNIHASGPLWKDHLFVYGLYSLRNNTTRDVVSQGTAYDITRDSDPFWGVKVDFFPIKNHHFEYTGFSDKSEVDTDEYDYDFATKSPVYKVSGTDVQPTKTYSKSGGRTDILRYTTTPLEDLSLSVLYGKNRADRTSGSTEDSKPAIYDTRKGHADWVSGNPDLSVSSGFDTREAYRFDTEYAFHLAGQHRLRGGYDYENNKSKEDTIYSGGVYWRYYTVTPGSSVSAAGGAIVPAGVTELVRERIYENKGSFQQKNSALYLEDNYTLLSDRLLLRLGLRNESFENLNANQQTFIKVDRQLAPRLGAAYDLFGDRSTKLFANYGRYHLPIASNTNIRLAGGEKFTSQYYILNGINADYTPIKGAVFGSKTILSDGSIKDPTTIVDKNITPMYQDEYVLGIQRALNKRWTAGIRTLSRDLKTSIDDVIVDQAIDAYAKRKGITDYVAGDHVYVLSNPGKDITFNYDLNGDGKLEEINLSSADLGFPKASRKYYSAEFFLERVWDEKWNLQFSYTWAHSYGNSEGLVKSDNGQGDAGLTSNFDALGLIENSYGDLPNDRRHAFKLFGSRALTKEFRLGTNLRLESGRPLNKLGVYPSAWDPIAAAYGVEAFWTGGAKGSASPRGSAGRTPWIFSQDLSFNYTPKWGGGHLNIGVDVFNVLNIHGVTESVEQYEQSTGEVSPYYGLAKAWQSPRSVRLSVNYEY